MGPHRLRIILIGLLFCLISCQAAVVDEATAVPTQISVAQATPTLRPTRTATVAPTLTSTPEATNTATPTKTATVAPTATAVATAASTATATLAATATSIATATSTDEPPTLTSTVAPSATVRPTNTNTPPIVATSTKQPPTAVATIRPNPTNTPAPQPSATKWPTQTSTPQPTTRPTQQATATKWPTQTPTPQPTARPTLAPTEIPTPANTATPIPTLWPTATPVPQPTAAPAQANQQPEVAFTHLVGDGSPASCNEQSLREAVSTGGVIGFNCGSAEHTLYINQPILLSQNTTLNGQGRVRLDGGGKSQLLQTGQRLNIRLEGLTFANGYTGDQGGALNLGYWSNLFIKDAIFTGNRADKDTAMCDGGGAIFVGGGSVATIENSQFSGNRAQNGGAINSLRSGLRIVDSTFYNNVARHSDRINQFGDCGGGGAVYIDGTRKPEDGGPDEIYLRGNRYENNVTNNHGGALFIAVRTGEKPIVAWSTFSGNVVNRHLSIETSGTGGAIWYGTGEGGVTDHFFTAHNNFFGGNRADFQGGAIWMLGAGKLSNSMFINNEAVNPAPLDKDDWRKGNGGAIAVAHQARVVLSSVTIMANRAGFNGGGVVGENLVAQNSIIASNVGDWHLGLQQNCTHALANYGNNLQFSTGAHQSNCGDTIPHVEPKMQTNYHTGQPFVLAPDSPAIDAGNNDTCPSIDLLGVARPWGTACDIGAYEYTGQQ